MDTIALLLILALILHPKIAHGSENTSDMGKESKLETYIVHVSQPEGTTFAQKEELQSWHRSFLPVTTASSMNKQQLVYSYKNVMSGFAARLTDEDVRAMETKDGFVSARPERVLQLRTTHSPAFLGLHQQTGLWRGSNLGKGMIIGVLDTGVFPNHPSFSNKGMSPPPAKWKGRCEFNATVCNNKLIGARAFHVAAKARKGMLAAETPLDDDGHGTHTASTAGGNFVYNVDVLGNAKGTAIGIAPHAHLAIYRVCFPGGQTDCSESDILAGIETAIEDGVDVISMSIVADSVPFFNDTMPIGLFAAIQKGVFVSCAAGNSGPLSSTTSNEAPWILTVGASTMDRRIVASAKLGSGQHFDGESLFQPSNFPPTLLPLVYAGMNGKPDSAVCGPGALNGSNVKGKVVLCDRGGRIDRIGKGQEVKNAGGAAMILANDKPNGFSTNADPHALPATHVSFAAGEQIKSYINSTKYPMATIVFKGTVIGEKSSPSVASFSSRGPSTASPGILKPDIIGPGVSILAAWPFPLNNDTKSTSTFNIISGTSMSCPHLSGIAALLKSSHPHWSPAAIKSAIMTTADVFNTGGKLIVNQAHQPADVLATGAGHVNPSKANAPGLVYDIQPNDYIPYLCGLGYTDEQVSIIAHRSISCSEKPSIPEGQLNYPSFSVILGPSQTFTRTLTNVGDLHSTYYVKIVSPPGVYVTVKPPRLQFLELYQKETYSITFSKAGGGWKNNSFAQGYIVWESTNTKYSVRSPISIRFKQVVM